MKCDTAQKYILLAESGELGRRARAVLTVHLAECPACSALLREYGNFSRAAAGILQANGPGSAALDSVRSEIRRTAPRQAVLFAMPAKLLALAAGLLAAAGVAWMLAGEGGSLARVRTVHAVVEVLSDGLVAGADGQSAHAEALRALAMDMLALEGLSADPYAENNLLSQPEELPATDPLSRSRSVCPEETCG
jgi:anti-sigma factor RsiW